jgi:uncharacterized protein
VAISDVWDGHVVRQKFGGLLAVTILISLIIGVLVVVFFISLYASLEITKIPFFAVPYTPKDYGWSYEDVSFRTQDGLTLKGWFVPAGGGPSPVTLIIHHGLGSNAGDKLENTACLQRTGKWNLFYFDMRGHGASEGEYNSLGPLELRDLESAIAYLREHKPAAARHLGIYGHSLGAAVAIIGAARHPELEAVAAESSFARASRTVVHFAKIFYGIPEVPFMKIALVLARWRLGVPVGQFDPVAEIGRISPRPIFLIHGERDRRIPRRELYALWKAAKSPKKLWIVRGADHGDTWMIAKEEYERRLVKFFEGAYQGRMI